MNEREASIEKEIPELINRVRAGDQEAFGVIARYLEPKLHSFFWRRIGPDGRQTNHFWLNEVDDLTQMTLTDIYQGFSSFDPVRYKRGEEDSLPVFKRWSFAIANHALVTEYRRQERQSLHKVVLSGNESDASLDYSEPSEDLMPRFRELLGDTLEPPLFQVVDFLLDGKSSEEAAVALGVKRSTVQRRLYEGRKVVYEKLFVPAGLKPISLYPKHIQYAIRRRAIGGLQFLDRWYTNDEAVEHYKPQGKIDPSMLEQGYILVRTLPDPVRNRLKNDPRLNSLILVHEGRLYIKRDICFT